MGFIERVAELIVLAFDYKAYKAAITWPKFSVTSYKMVTSLAKQGITPDIIIDVGANVGQFAVASKMIYPDVYVYSFEPQPDCVIELRKNVTTLKNVTVFPLALGEQAGDMNMYLNTHSHSSSFLPLADGHKDAFPDAKQRESLNIQVSTLDDEIKDLDLSAVVLLKLDVQGYEENVLLGASSALQHVDYVILEASFRPMYEGEKLFVDILSMMTKFGFKFLRPVDWLKNPKTGEVIQMDVLFVRHSD